MLLWDRLNIRLPCRHEQFDPWLPQMDLSPKQPQQHGGVPFEDVNETPVEGKHDVHATKRASPEHAGKQAITFLRTPAWNSKAVIHRLERLAFPQAERPTSDVLGLFQKLADDCPPKKVSGNWQQTTGDMTPSTQHHL